jgi:hypothetical protein
MSTKYGEGTFPLDLSEGGRRMLAAIRRGVNP